jgi:hypothetical protein
VNQVWTSDITYIRMNEGFTYFLAIVDLSCQPMIDWEVGLGGGGQYSCCDKDEPLLTVPKTLS